MSKILDFVYISKFLGAGKRLLLFTWKFIAKFLHKNFSRAERQQIFSEKSI